MENSEVSPRGIFCNRTLNLRSIRAIGYDMDYTLIHYKVEEWELMAYNYLKQHLVEKKWPVGHLEFDSQLVMRGLVIDLELGNVVKANRFGYIKKSCHGTKMMAFDGIRSAYRHTIVDLKDPRYLFLNTLFSLSEGCFFLQCVDLFDKDKIPGENLGYEELYEEIHKVIDTLHKNGVLKAEITSNPDKYVDVDRETPLALLDQKNAGKKLLLITNSEWDYTQAMMKHCFDPYLEGKTWRDLFDIVIVMARKPDFFEGNPPAFEVINKEGHLIPVSTNRLEIGGVYLGGNANMVEAGLGVGGERILYVGDHMFSDVNVSKNILRWRTALVLRELEEEIGALKGFEEQQEKLTKLMEEKVALEQIYTQCRLHLQRLSQKYGPQPKESEEELKNKLRDAQGKIETLDAQISPLAKAAGELLNPSWGLVMRAGNNKSHLARQVEQYADIYLSRVSNFLDLSPYAYLRSQRSSLPHDSYVTEDRMTMEAIYS